MLKTLVKRTIRGIGFDLHRYEPNTSESARIMKMLSFHGVNLVFDIGANIGQFATFLRELGYRGRIVSFEPIANSWKQLEYLSRSDPLWEVAPRCALGADEGEVEIHVAGTSGSSSILDMLEMHLAAAPHSGYVRNERAPIHVLDRIGREYIRSDSKMLIKIDTQGYEAQVLRGASQLLTVAVGLQVELSLIPLYAGQALQDEITNFLQSKGFGLWGIAPVLSDPHTGRLLQFDATFFRV